MRVDGDGDNIGEFGVPAVSGNVEVVGRSVEVAGKSVEGGSIVKGGCSLTEVILIVALGISFMVIWLVTYIIVLCTFSVNMSACVTSSTSSLVICYNISASHHRRIVFFSSSAILHCLSLVNVDSGLSGFSITSYICIIVRLANALWPPPIFSSKLPPLLRKNQREQLITPSMFRFWWEISIKTHR